MAMSKILILTVTLFISQLILLHLTEAQQLVKNVDDDNQVKVLLENIDCGAACEVRCQKASRRKMCNRACGTCCARCDCVPPGTSGHQDECPCYFNQTTHGGKLKCP